jgi:hypothetical protein
MCEGGNHGGFSTLVLFDMMLFSQTAPLRNSHALLRNRNSTACGNCVCFTVCSCFLLLKDVLYCSKQKVCYWYVLLLATTAGEASALTWFTKQYCDNQNDYY